MEDGKGGTECLRRIIVRRLVFDSGNGRWCFRGVLHPDMDFRYGRFPYPCADIIT